MGIHHVTAIAREPQRNLDFYAGTLGMRLVKLTVNYDDPGTYHLYYGDDLGRPGSLLTFFPWTGGRPGRRGVKYEGPVRRFDERVLAFPDPDGRLLELIATPRVNLVDGWRDGPVPAGHAVRGVHAVTIWEDGDAGSADFLTRTMGFRAKGEEENRLRFESGHDGLGTVVDLPRAPGFWRGTDGVGTVHHVAFRAADDAEQKVRQEELKRLGVGVTDVRDRNYFRSIYFREPGGVLFEIATDGPGFSVDQLPAELGTTLKLPPQYETMRERLERSLAPLRLPHAEAMER